MSKPIFYHITGESGGDIINLAEATRINIAKETDLHGKGLHCYYLVVHYKNGSFSRIPIAIHDEMEAQEYLKGMFRYLQSEMARD